MKDTRSTGEETTRRSLRSFPLGYIAIAAILLIALVAGGIILGGCLADLRPDQNSSPPLPFEDRTSPEQLAAHEAQAIERLNSSGWVDPEAGIAHIPIETAMELLAERGLPVYVATQETDPPAAEETAPPAGEEAEGEGAGSEGTAASPDVDLSQVTYQEHVLPIFETYCGECHGAEDPEEQLELTRYRTALVGSMNGPVIELGDPDNSYLVKQIVEGRMPKDADPLSPEDIEIIIAWIEAGAPEQ